MPNKYALSWDDLERIAHVPVEDQVEERDTAVTALDDDAVGHLPGNVRPYGA
ncbi:MAG: hypothetical protein JWP11_1732 [Frankiales bacterium]|nr:hypothetical protein [Frankiales bacterium]